MVPVCIYFQIHQPRRLRLYSVFDDHGNYFDDATNERILKKVAEKCYLPATEQLLDMLDRHGGRFRVAFSITGSAIEQFRAYCPKVVELLKKLAQTGCVEFLGETYHHSLASLFSQEEFYEQIRLHDALMFETFGMRPTVFRNTELVYDNGLARLVASAGRYKAILCEGIDFLLDGRSPNCLYTPPDDSNLKLLLKNYRLSDDVAFRFSDRNWSGWPLTASKFVDSIASLNRESRTCNLFMDYETFGEHQWKDSGIFEFLDCLPDEILKRDGGRFLLPSELIAEYEASEEYNSPHPTSWADTERDLSAWLGNAMQSSAMHELYRLENRVKGSGDSQLLRDWRDLTTSDHFYYMCTKYYDDGAVHKYFSPYESPYDSYINFMNVLDHVKQRVGIEVN